MHIILSNSISQSFRECSLSSSFSIVIVLLFFHETITHDGEYILFKYAYYMFFKIGNLERTSRMAPQTQTCLQTGTTHLLSGVFESFIYFIS